ncbi:hypothetical protein OIB37_03935 [Streptomyces sp. NBC_00820]|uniref:hypothetical protein n=1 Tax=Streptomyces sp. NBC_00820 TaxID=2975842 RepID=UPI002ED3ED3F|nr:hypothetical protein OIB37_03935 [Streptomyces sp. NBC_00820]
MSMTSRLGLLRDPDFGRLFVATALGQLGDRIILLALPLVAIVALDVGEFQVGLLTAATMAGSLLVGLPAGAWVDRMRKRSEMILTDLGGVVWISSGPRRPARHLAALSDQPSTSSSGRSSALRGTAPDAAA